MKTKSKITKKRSRAGQSRALAVAPSWPLKWDTPFYDNDGSHIAKKDWPLAVMFERTEPPSNPYGNTHGDEMEEGTRIWQHGRGEWVPGHPDNERRMSKANASDEPRGQNTK